MERYQVSLIARPGDWQPQAPDDVPPRPAEPQEILGETADLLEAAPQAIEFNEAPRAETDCRWAVIVEPGSLGQTWPGMRLCTPLYYQVTAVWWPAGWEPASPLDMPNCGSRIQNAPGKERHNYSQALARAWALNQQAMDRAAPLWYVVIAVENEPISKCVSFDSSGTETISEVHRVHIVRPDKSGKGTCPHCPARSMDCSQDTQRATIEEMVTMTTRPAPAT